MALMLSLFQHDNPFLLKELLITLVPKQELMNK